MSFENLNLDRTLMRSIEACGFSVPTDIQRQAIPVVLNGRDLMASAPTGTGKTGAFVLPALQRLLAQGGVAPRGPRVLVLTPTRELAVQVEQNVRQFGQFSRPIVASVVGGVPYPPQIRALGKPMDILVATPGRLMDHMERNRVDLSGVELLVLDEADRMLDMGFVDDVMFIAKATPSSRQTLLFSATLEGRVMGVARQLLKEPETIQLAANKTPHEKIVQRVHWADDIGHKHALLDHILGASDLEQAVIFTATNVGAEALARQLLDNGHQSAALHGDMSQGERRRTVERMRQQHVRVLVATDVAARGLDIKGISHVINFDLPMSPEDYIHRIGRTARGGASGVAISLIGPQDRRKLVGIERLTGRRLERTVLPGLEPKAQDKKPGPPRDGYRADRRGQRRPSAPHGEARAFDRPMRRSGNRAGTGSRSDR